MVFAGIASDAVRGFAVDSRQYWFALPVTVAPFLRKTTVTFPAVTFAFVTIVHALT